MFLALGLAGTAFLLAHAMIGSGIDEQGFLREPFFLLPLGFVSMLTGTAGALFVGLKRLVLGQTA